jgi:hypothetical protein
MINHRLHAGAALAFKGRYQPALVGARASASTSYLVPAGVQPGDFAIVFVGGKYTAFGSPAGWTKLSDYNTKRPYFESFYTFLPDPVASSYAFSGTELGVMAFFRNVDTSTPLDVTPPALTETDTPPAITTAENRSTIVVAHGCYNVNSSQSPEPPTGYQQIGRAYDGADNDYWFAASYRTTLTSGTFTPDPYTTDGSTSWGSVWASPNLVSATVALRGAQIP